METLREAEISSQWETRSFRPGAWNSLRKWFSYGITLKIHIRFLTEPPRFRVSDSALWLRAEDADVGVLLRMAAGRQRLLLPTGAGSIFPAIDFPSSRVWGEAADVPPRLRQTLRGRPPSRLGP
ncbi:hypothetical protein EYF80_060929 [Liparis tanakae]|uniref:Uncharacterized protein n=1 Tax=Liparis tanakae TaxID=230148 RepID=A0A4Z2EJC8_9TELE|nr:hypothetical protein EYF80_060929 [Liparis tanakae]